MPIQTSGTISIADIVNEFGGSSPHSLSEYYGIDDNIPTSGTISIDDFYGASSGFYINTASYDNVSFDPSSEDPNPFDITFNSDGTKMFMVGSTNKYVYQYTLTTGFNISTASYDNVSLSVNAQDTQPISIEFSSDGTKMFMVGSNNDSVYQYTLTTGFNLSTASYDNVSFGFGSQDSNTRCVEFNSDGTKMLMFGAGNDSVYQYTLTTGFNISTASYDNVSFGFGNLGGAEFGSGLTSIVLNNKGTKMFMLSQAEDRVYKYTLTTGFNLSTASYDNVSFSVSAQDGLPISIEFSSDGTKMFIVGLNNDSVYQYTSRNTI
jgi:hypothetical protein